MFLSSGQFLIWTKQKKTDMDARSTASRDPLFAFEEIMHPKARFFAPSGRKALSDAFGQKDGPFDR
jgi:hypothetical protein